MSLSQNEGDLLRELQDHFTLRSEESGQWNQSSDDALQLLVPPPFLRAMWMRSSEWHLLPDQHYDVFGFNLYAPHRLKEVTRQIFGDEDLRQQLCAQDEGILCANDGWFVCFAFSEYDFLLVNFDSSDPLHYGTVRHYVNNCNEESVCCDSVVTLMKHVLNFVRNAKRQKEEALLLELSERQNDPQPGAMHPRCPEEYSSPVLRRIRHAITDAILEEYA